MVDQDAIWDHFQTVGVEVFAGCRPRVVRLLGLISGGRVLNIGVGNACFETLAQRKGLDVHCLDPSQASIDLVRRHLGLGEKAAAGRAEAIPFGAGLFDAVVASEVLEHLNDETLASALRDIHRVLAPGGRFLGTVPRNENLKEQFTVCPCCGSGFHRWGHRQSFTRERLAEVLGETFLEVQVRSALFVDWRSLNLVGKAVSALKLLAFRCGRHGGGESLLFTARKQGEA